MTTFHQHIWGSTHSTTWTLGLRMDSNLSDHQHNVDYYVCSPTLPFPQSNAHPFLSAHFLLSGFTHWPIYPVSIGNLQTSMLCSLGFYSRLTLQITEPERNNVYISISTVWKISNLFFGQTTDISSRPLFSLTYWILPSLCFIEISKSANSKVFPSPVFPPLLRRSHPQL